MKHSLTICLAAAVCAWAGGPAIGATWNVPGDFDFIQEAIDSVSVQAGDVILVGAGSHAGALVTKSVEIVGEDGAVIDSGPVHSSGLIQGFRMMAGSDGAAIKHLRFEVDLAIMNGEAVDDVVVAHCVFINAIQAISNWSGSSWKIRHNVITDLRTSCGGGIGILIADYTGSIVEDNVVSHNKIRGTLHVDPNDCGGYDGSGIVLYADFRWDREGAEEIKDNRIVKNKIGLVSNDPNVVDVVAFELTDTRDDDQFRDVLFDNRIGFNDFRRTFVQIFITPTIIEDDNYISRNLGDNRGQGLHPGIFGPGGN